MLSKVLSYKLWCVVRLACWYSWCYSKEIAKCYCLSCYEEKKCQCRKNKPDCSSYSKNHYPRGKWRIQSESVESWGGDYQPYNVIYFSFCAKVGWVWEKIQICRVRIQFSNLKLMTKLSSFVNSLDSTPCVCPREVASLQTDVLPNVWHPDGGNSVHHWKQHSPRKPLYKRNIYIPLIFCM